MVSTRSKKTSSRKSKAPIIKKSSQKKQKPQVDRKPVYNRALPAIIDVPLLAYDEIKGAICLDTSSSSSVPGPTAALRRKLATNPNYIARPRNSFIIFRGLMCMLFCPPEAKDMSAWVSWQWSILSPESKQHFQDLAEEEKRRHTLKYPNYEYKPDHSERKKNVKVRPYEAKECKEESKEASVLAVEGLNVNHNTSSESSSPATSSEFSSPATSSESSSPATPSDQLSSPPFPSPSFVPDSSAAPPSSLACSQSTVPPFVNFPFNSTQFYAQQPSTSLCASCYSRMSQPSHPGFYGGIHNQFPMPPMGPAGPAMFFSGSYPNMAFGAGNNLNTTLPQFAFAPSYTPDSLIDPRLRLLGYNLSSSSSQHQTGINDPALGYIPPGGHEVELSPSALRIDQQAVEEYFAAPGAEQFFQAQAPSFAPMPSSPSLTLASPSSSSASEPSMSSFAPTNDSASFMSNLDNVFLPRMASQADLNAESDGIDLSWVSDEVVIPESTIF